MRLDAILEVVNNVANGYRKNNACQSRLCLAKDEKSSKYYLIVNNCKKPTNDKFRVIYLIYPLNLLLSMASSIFYFLFYISWLEMLKKFIVNLRTKAKQQLFSKNRISLLFCKKLTLLN